VAAGPGDCALSGAELELAWLAGVTGGTSAAVPVGSADDDVSPSSDSAGVSSSTVSPCVSDGSARSSTPSSSAPFTVPRLSPSQLYLTRCNQMASTARYVYDAWTGRCVAPSQPASASKASNNNAVRPAWPVNCVISRHDTRSACAAATNGQTIAGRSAFRSSMPTLRRRPLPATRHPGQRQLARQRRRCQHPPRRRFRWLRRFARSPRDSGPHPDSRA
jgi:hypothetical protein